MIRSVTWETSFVSPTLFRVITSHFSGVVMIIWEREMLGREIQCAKSTEETHTCVFSSSNLLTFVSPVTSSTRILYALRRSLNVLTISEANAFMGAT